MITAFLRFCAVQTAASGGKYDTTRNSSAASVASTMLMLGPAASHQHHIAARMAQGAKIDRHRLGIAEQKRCSHEQKHGRHYDGAEQIDVLQRIQAHPPKPPSRVITQLVRH